MGFEKPQDYVDALKRLEGLPLMGMEIKDGRLVFHSLSRHVALPMDRQKGCGYGITDYGLNKLDVTVDHVNYHDHFKRVMLFDEDSNIIAHVTVKNLYSSMNVNQYKKYSLLTKGVVFTAEADGLTGVFVNWLAMDSPVDRIIDRGESICIMTGRGGAVELLFKEEDIDD